MRYELRQNCCRYQSLSFVISLHEGNQELIQCRNHVVPLSANASRHQLNRLRVISDARQLSPTIILVHEHSDVILTSQGNKSFECRNAQICSRTFARFALRKGNRRVKNKNSKKDNHLPLNLAARTFDQPKFQSASTAFQRREQTWLAQFREQQARQKYQPKQQSHSLPRKDHVESVI